MSKHVSGTTRLLGQTEIQTVFDKMGLASEKSRKAFKMLAPVDVHIRDGAHIFIRYDTATRKEKDNARLASDSERDSARG